MKYGQQLERESVPEWSLHNLDYNALKHEIKVHTTRDQATAMAIPGYEDPALRRFEDGLYNELCRQHDRLDLFIASKADEISRRLEHLVESLNRWLAKSHDQLTPEPSLKYQRRFAKYERELLRCGGDTQALMRFANAQVIAFRKILKKYKKWTGSTTLGSRVNQNILSDPKSFTRRDFSILQNRYDEISAILHASAPVISEPSSPESISQPFPDPTRPRSSRSRQQSDFEPLPPPQMAEQIKYWNEYDNGSECGSPDDEYAIYVNPDDYTSFPGLDYVQGIFRVPMEKARRWFNLGNSPEQRPLLGANNSFVGYSSTATTTESDEEGYASSGCYPQAGYAAHYALPSVAQQKVLRYRENVLFWGTIGCFIASFILLGVAGILISTGRHKLRVEVDAGVTFGVVASLFSACSALGMTLYRRDPLPPSYKLMVWSTFVASCLLNGMLLVLVVGNSP
ncbi:Fc.00g100850.m01.CDS01 [Cosmosporella sp. VM-42]